MVVKQTKTPDKSRIEIHVTKSTCRIKKKIKYIDKSQQNTKLKTMCYKCKFLDYAQMDIEGIHMALCCTANEDDGWREIKGKAKIDKCDMFYETDDRLKHPDLI